MVFRWLESLSAHFRHLTKPLRMEKSLFGFWGGPCAPASEALMALFGVSAHMSLLMLLAQRPWDGSTSTVQGQVCLLGKIPGALLLQENWEFGLQAFTPAPPSDPAQTTLSNTISFHAWELWYQDFFGCSHWEHLKCCTSLTSFTKAHIIYKSSWSTKRLLQIKEKHWDQS